MPLDHRPQLRLHADLAAFAPRQRRTTSTQAQPIPNPPAAPASVGTSTAAVGPWITKPIQKPTRPRIAPQAQTMMFVDMMRLLGSGSSQNT
jgi:hypothetical protein